MASKKGIKSGLPRNTLKNYNSDNTESWWFDDPKGIVVYIKDGNNWAKWCCISWASLRAALRRTDTK